MIDFRSDTVTQPTEQMLDFMLRAKVGDDVFHDDPTTLELERFGAEMFGKEAALFCASGTMSNQIAIKVHTRPGDEMICHENAHVYRYEGGGMAFNSGVSPKLVNNPSGKIEATDIADLINPDDPHYPQTVLVSLEDTANRAGGIYYDIHEVERIYHVCKQNGLMLHVDGARIFNALTETGVDPAVYGQFADSISICLSKGLGAPAGTLLIGNQEFIRQAIRVRKVFGGGMRQTGYYAAAGIYALQNNILRLKEDHLKAVRIGKVLSKLPWVNTVLPVQTNIILAEIDPGYTVENAINTLQKHGIACLAFGKTRIRLVTHLGITDEDVEYVENLKI
ncbi:MAG TPA: threonine aldolase [Saprospirales bacterium]|nr:threonine aldolase [Saprospirales bacterium]HAY71325.1 threonine aldolase [Saprospirales bacterium]HRQ29667.1 GntG family PLP-dependent aldolase [Saprospiraceae bacterium]